MGDDSQKENSYRSACTECARRKQKCNREWPCNHCQKRKVADKCRFKDANQPAVEKAASDNLRKRRLNNDASTESEEFDIDDTESDGIDALGYMPAHVLFGLTAQDETIKASSREFVKDPKIFPQLERALQVIPPRPYTDILVQNFLNNVNFHYYIIYPPSFLEQYQQWWIARGDNRPLSVQWTALLLMVCACASQYTDIDLQRKLEVDLGDTIQRLTEQYHEAARELGSTIPIGYSHITNVQQLLHSCYWFKSEARFVECWHVLNSAIREAQELSIHQESKADPVPEFELEIRRRVWCVMDTWDWQISALLGRPMIIDRADCEVGLPNLGLEGMQHSPLTHMKMQSSLIRQLFGRFGLTKNVVAPADVQEYQNIIEAWIKDFPPPFNVHNPDKALDASCPWIVLHRHYLRTMAFSMLLDPIRAFLARPFTIRSSEAELQIRSDGIDYCLELMVSLRGFFDHVYPRDAKFHFVLFCIFDTSTVLCSAVLHDEHHTLPRRDDVFKAIDEAHAMLQRLRMVTKSAKTSYGILTRIVQRLPRTVVTPKVATGSPSNKKARFADADAPPQTGSHQSGSPPLISPPTTTMTAPITPATAASSAGAPSMPSLPIASSGEISSEAYAAPAPAPYIEWQPQMVAQDPTNFTTTQLPPSDAVFANISDEELGELASLWNYQSLDFSFINP
ncbi:Zn(2)-C6 fungal-type domain-containing protein [Fusarium falciforme]|uniref:Zn(2)-C6 fungal-type domain-containing protein n=1 Tax=Fusarium falciforme TaxID=195108 RepID=UPI0023016D6A|nr:Zn(2)-C6 fungal-type domain-containing protein [Fusarium falciforme]WAO83982.1 Zn(2)-C6 fungal-type domain-containing protein [Fusarium falciforme]